MKCPSNLLTEYFVKENKIDINKEYDVAVVPAKSLFCSNRFDLMAKWIYVNAYEKAVYTDIAEEIYYDNINAFSKGSFREPGTKEKNSFEAYLSEFRKLIEDIKVNGFDSNKSIVPVGKNDVLLDGAHRVTVAAYYDLDVTVIRFPNLERKFDYNYFRRYLMRDLNLAYMAVAYSQIKDNCYLACVWPTVDRNGNHIVEKELLSVGSIVYKQEVLLNYNGMRNFMIHIYGHQDWTGGLDNNFSGVKKKLDACFVENKAVTAYLFELKEGQSVIEIKKKIRKLLKLAKHSIHISDDSYETRKMAELLYIPKNVDELNYCDLCLKEGEFSKESDLDKIKTYTKGEHIRKLQMKYHLYGFGSFYNLNLNYIKDRITEMVVNFYYHFNERK